MKMKTKWMFFSFLFLKRLKVKIHMVITIFRSDESFSWRSFACVFLCVFCSCCACVRVCVCIGLVGHNSRQTIEWLIVGSHSASKVWTRDTRIHCLGKPQIERFWIIEIIGLQRAIVHVLYSNGFICFDFHYPRLNNNSMEHTISITCDDTAEFSNQRCTFST